MITEKEFLDALDIVKKYREQINNLVDDVELSASQRTLFNLEWLNKQDISVRLYNVLHAYMNHHKSKQYVDEVSRNEFLCIRNAGNRSWEEFCKLTERQFV